MTRERGFARIDKPDESELRCPCGAWFTWAALDPRLEAWLATHQPHADNTNVEATLGGKTTIHMRLATFDTGHGVQLELRLNEHQRLAYNMSPNEAEELAQQLALFAKAAQESGRQPR